MAQPDRPLGPATPPEAAGSDALLSSTRRDFMKFVVVGGSSLIVGGSFLTREEAAAQEIPDLFDVGDFIILAEEGYSAPPTSNLVLEVTPHNRVRFELPRLDKGQGIITAVAMLIAEEMDADYDRTDVELSDAREDRPNSLTGYSNTVRAMWPWVRPLAAEARARLLVAAGNRWSVDPTTLTVRASMILDEVGDRAASFGELAAEAADPLLVVPPGLADPKPVTSLTNLLGNPTGRKNARDIVTGKQKYTLDLDVPGAVYAVLARPPNVRATVSSINNQPTVEAMPGVVGVVNIPQSPNLPNGHAIEGGVAVAATNFQQAFDAVAALDITWNAGPLAMQSDTELETALESANTALLPVSPLDGSLDAEFDYPYVNHAPLEVQTGISTVDVGANTVEAWFSSQSPLYTAQLIEDATGVPVANVAVHIAPCGGSFGRHLFSEAVVEASIVSKELYGAITPNTPVPVKLMWPRTDDMRNGRFRPKAHADLRASWDSVTGDIKTFEHNLSAAETDFKHGLGDAVSAAGFETAAQALNQSVFEGSVTLPYAFPEDPTVPSYKEMRLKETFFELPTCSWRSIYSGYTITTNEIFVDELARATQPLSGRDEVDFRLHYLTSPEGLRAAACLNKVLDMAGLSGSPRPPLPSNVGVAIHVEYRSAVAHLVEIDVTTDPANPRLSAAYIAVDVGIPLNPKGVEAQLQGALIDAWSVMFRAGNHVDKTLGVNDPTIRETAYSNFEWARMNHAPPTTEVYVFSQSETGATEPGGCGELGLPPACAACVNAYARATGTYPPGSPVLEYRFPIGDPVA